jgi:hypothetical protein
MRVYICVYSELTLRIAAYSEAAEINMYTQLAEYPMHVFNQWHS